MGASSMKLGATDNDITCWLLADVTMMKATLAAEHGQMAFLGYGMTSWDKTITSGLLTDVAMRMVTLTA